MLTKNSFAEIAYTGSLKENGSVFDTTDEETAKKNGIHNPRMKFGSMVICVGQKQLIPGFDDSLVGKEAGKDYTFDIKPEHAFGKKDPKLLQLISTSKFIKANIHPMPGLQVNIDNQIGIVKTVSGGRTLVDFNHPLAGKEIIYRVKILSQVHDPKRKVSCLVKTAFGIEDPSLSFEDGKAVVSINIDLPKEIQNLISKKITELVPEVKEITFVKTS